MINRVVLVGRLTRDIELRYTNSGAAVASFTVAVNRQFTNASGEREADFINCVIWRKAAENFANFTKKGSLVGIDGRIQTRSYENQQGQRVYVTEVVVENFSLLEPRSTTERREDGSSSNNFSGNNHNTSNQNSQPSAGNNQKSNDTDMQDPFADNGQSIDISDDDLPF
ncbi:single-stranded DNA-binding protein [Agrilactobacillus fermenti]|uniref:single-stranded DNA-binding protein n=1 Tax=Agrilactobacillus fermenti TaxID=2586909 RepID=UPI001E3BD2BB|nr:single-stranded DNA-binding protein [Agrilactobacillus fermenti]MCD2257153.1 single-stranded DNA-binding protein [Agrilactobacillus fermenti]